MIATRKVGALLVVVATVTGGCADAAPSATTTTSTTQADVSAPCVSADTDWPLSGRDLTYASHLESDTAVDSGSAGSLVEAWRHEGIGGVSGTPVVVDASVFYADWNGTVHRTDACTGEQVWSSTFKGAPIAVSVAVHDGTVVASNIDGDIFAFDGATGELAWSADLGGGLPSAGYGAPVIVGDIVVTGVAMGQAITRSRGSIVAFDLHSGDELWRTFTDNDDPKEGGGVAVWSSPAIDVDRRAVYIGTGNSNVVFKDAERVPDSPFANAIMAMSLDTGEVLWVTRMIEADRGKDFDIGAPPTLFQADGRDLVGVGGKNGEFFALDRHTGDQVWRVLLTQGSEAGGVMKAAAYRDGVLFVVSNAGVLKDGRMFALDARDGTELWAAGFDAAFLGHNVSVVNDVVFIGDLDGVVTALDAANGTVLWTSDPVGERLQGGLSASGPFIFVGYGGPTLPPHVPTEIGGVVVYTIAP